MRKENKKIFILCIFAAALSITFIVLCLIYTHLRGNPENNLSSSSEFLADEARSNISVESIISSEIDSGIISSSITTSENISSKASTLSGTASSQSPVKISDDSGEWNLRLVNAKNILPDDFSPALSTISMDYARDKGMKFDTRALEALENMCAAAKADGVRLMVISAYRSFATQESLYNEKVNYYLERGYSVEEAKEVAATIRARPKTSEHNLGLAVDFNSVEEDFDQTAEYRWLQNHCTKYGFIMRYPKSKQSITGVIYEPWHYRYVGVSVAEQITKKGITLEEYLGKN